MAQAGWAGPGSWCNVWRDVWHRRSVDPPSATRRSGARSEKAWVPAAAETVVCRGRRELRCKGWRDPRRQRLSCSQKCPAPHKVPAPYSTLRTAHPQNCHLPALPDIHSAAKGAARGLRRVPVETRARGWQARSALIGPIGSICQVLRPWKAPRARFYEPKPSQRPASRCHCPSSAPATPTTALKLGPLRNWRHRSAGGLDVHPSRKSAKSAVCCSPTCPRTIR